MDKTDDIDDCSEFGVNKTDNDVICCEKEYTKKRKKNNSKQYELVNYRNGVKKLNTFKAKTKKLEIVDIKLKSNALVYTTRLNEMPILHTKIKYLDNILVMDIISAASKPQYNCYKQKCNCNVIKTISFDLLKTALKKLSRKRKVILDDDYYDLSSEGSEVVPSKKITLINEKNTKIEGNNKCNVVIVINNLSLKLSEIYVTDGNCKLIEYHSTKCNYDNFTSQFNNVKSKLILNACCWYRRQQVIEAIQPKRSFFRFLITTHKCPLDQCICCCKPKQVTTGVVLYKQSATDVLKYNVNKEILEDNENLILPTLYCKKLNTDNHIFTSKKLVPGKPRSYTLKRINFSRKISNFECFQIGTNQDIIRFNFGIDWRDYRRLCSYCLPTSNVSCSLCRKASVCCTFNRDQYLRTQYEEGILSANTLKFLKKTSTDFCTICKKLTPGNKTKQNSNVINAIPKIEHTRISIKPTLLKINNEKQFKAPDFTIDKICSFSNLTPQILRELKSSYGKLATSNNCDNITDLTDLKVSPNIFKTIKKSFTKCIKDHISHNTNKIFKKRVDNVLSNLEYGNKVLKSFDDKSIKNLNDTIYTCLFDTNNESKMKTYGRKNQLPAKVDTDLSKNKIHNDISIKCETGTVELKDTFADKFLKHFDPYDRFAKVITHSKKCYANSFDSYINVDHQSQSSLPKISSVFSLKVNHGPTHACEPLPSTSKHGDTLHNSNADISTAVIGDNLNFNAAGSTTGIEENLNNSNTDLSTAGIGENLNNLNANTPTAGIGENLNYNSDLRQPILVFNAVTKCLQLVYPDGTTVPIVKTLTTSNPSNHLQPIMTLENNLKPFSVLTTVNPICNGNILEQILSVKPEPEHSILPDIITDIPKNIYDRDGDNDVIVVKKEEVDDIVVLDSD